MEDQVLEKLDRVNNLAYAIHDHIDSALKGTANVPYSIDQIKAEILAERDAIIKQMTLAGTLPYKSLLQDINCVELDCENLSMCCKVETYDKVLHFKLPKLASFLYESIPVYYIGLSDRTERFQIKQTLSPFYKTYNKWTRESAKPYVWFASNREDGFLFNPPSENLKYISVTAVFENPMELSKYGCCTLSDIDAGLIPSWMSVQILQNIVNRFTTSMYKIKAKVNDQTSH